MIIQIRDDLDLHKISASGQCFRVKTFENNIYRFITGRNVLYIRQVNNIEFSVSCTMQEWTDIWFPYFDLERDYRLIRNQIPRQDTFLMKAADAGKGIRILRQEHFETLISFIISQRKSIPAIKQSIDLLCEQYGEPIHTSYETVYAFPTSEELLKVTKEDLIACKVGYRTDYIQDAVSKVFNGYISLSSLEGLSDEALLNSLLTIYGVGIKVANCVALFSYNRTSLAPIDTWVRKVIDQEYNGADPFVSFGNTAGILQQYVFYYALQHKKEF